MLLTCMEYAMFRRQESSCKNEQGYDRHPVKYKWFENFESVRAHLIMCLRKPKVY